MYEFKKHAFTSSATLHSDSEQIMTNSPKTGSIFPTLPGFMSSKISNQIYLPYFATTSCSSLLHKIIVIFSNLFRDKHAPTFTRIDNTLQRFPVKYFPTFPRINILQLCTGLIFSNLF